MTGTSQQRRRIDSFLALAGEELTAEETTKRQTAIDALRAAVLAFLHLDCAEKE